MSHAGAEQLRRVEQTAAELRTASDPRALSRLTLRRAALADTETDWHHWPDVRPIARDVVYTAGALTAADMSARVRLADVDPDDPVLVRLFEVQGDLENLASQAQSSADGACSRYHILRHRGGLDPDAALEQAVCEVSPFWRSTPRRFLRAGQRIRFGTVHKTWQVQAVSDNYVALVQQAPFEPKGTLQYSVIDWARGIRGPANLIGWGYGDGSYSRDECARMLREFEYDITTDLSEVSGDDDDDSESDMQGLEVSHRNNVEIYEFAVLHAS